MAEDPLDAVNAFVERAYVRLQAGEMLTYCLEKGDKAPMLDLAQDLVVAGPQSLNALREVLAEVSSRKAQLQEDMRQVILDLDQKLKQYGVSLNPAQAEPNAFVCLSIRSFLRTLRKQGVEEKQVFISLELLSCAQELAVRLLEHLRLLDEVERYLSDWLWGLVYQAAHEGRTSLNHRLT